MSATIVPPAVDATTRRPVRPRYEGSNICTWIGFKHVNYLVEEAVLDHLRRHGMPAGTLYERFGLCVDLVDLDTRILHAFHIDDVAVAEVRRLPDPATTGLAFAVEITVDRGERLRAVAAKVLVQLRLDPDGADAEPVPDALAGYVTDRLAGVTRRAPRVPDLLAGTDPRDALTAGRNAVAWSWRIPYFYCHFTRRVQMSGYLRLMEEVVDLFLAERKISIDTLLREQSWIPVVPHSQITVLDEALMEEEVHTVLTVENVFKGFTYTARMDCYVLRDGVLTPVATGRITHGYAVIENRRDWHLVEFDDRMRDALGGGAASVTGRGRAGAGARP
ncbi:thioesterase family protein [Catenuloplanes indicus]|uniref:Acyl-CoA thioesterase FadM n=1 Tax=Catenuloplanes indicus TaxID=137267 RepID=A0AAE3VUK5_9ACTN|nr:thioesterase family protein [Catenuloplanes indicus]MDQ0363897.1 acyl-CoA thioesterase FadM [Catenuloplanes indicus]